MALQAGISITQNLRPLQNIRERNADPDEVIRSSHDNAAAKMRVAIPCQVISFDPETCTVDVKPLIREKIVDRSTGATRWEELPVLPKVPVCFPQGGNMVMTVPITAGDEISVLFQDTSIEAWQASGGISNWVDKRRHDLSDGIALVGLNSKPNVIPNIATDAIEIRTKTPGTKIRLETDQTLIQKLDPINGTVLSQIKSDLAGIELSGVAVRIAAATLILDVASIISESDDPLVIQANAMEFNANTTIDLNGQLRSNGHNYLDHRHSGVQTGGGTSATVVP